MKILFLFLTIIFFSCHSFEPYENPSQPQSCNDKITYMKLIIKTNKMFNKSGTLAFLTLLSQADAACREDRKNFRKTKCYDEAVKIIYGEKILPAKENYKKYSEFKFLLDKCNPEMGAR